MVDFSKISKEKELTQLFISMHDVSEIRWLLDKAGINEDECYMCSWKQVLAHEVSAIEHISDEERDEEIDRLYGEDAEYVKTAPAVLISHYKVDELLKALDDTLFGTGDRDYNEYSKKRQAEIDEETSEI